MPTLPAVPAGEGQAPQAGDARFLESDQFQEMLQTYRRLKPLAEEKPRTFKKQLQEFDFRDIYPLMDEYLQTHILDSPEDLRRAVLEPDGETVSFSQALQEIFETSLSARTTEYDILGNSPATYFICGVWANMKRGREFHPASNGITVTYSKPDAYGNQNIRYRNKDYEMTLILDRKSVV